MENSGKGTAIFLVIIVGGLMIMGHLFQGCSEHKSSRTAVIIQYSGGKIINVWKVMDDEYSRIGDHVQIQVDGDELAIPEDSVNIIRNGFKGKGVSTFNKYCEYHIAFHKKSYNEHCEHNQSK